MRIGLFGGSFNPLHCGHIDMARNVKREFSLDKVLFIVAKEPPHKEIAFDVPAHIRYKMTAEALFCEDGIYASDIELLRDGKSYTVDTLEMITRDVGGAELFFIVGEDMLINLPKWRSPERVLALSTLIAVPRPGYDGDIQEPAEYIRKSYGANVLTANFTGLDISSTKAREMIYAAEDTSEVLLASVENAIYDNALYMPEEILDICAKLKSSVSDKRFLHCCGVMQAAVKLARRYGADANAARLAGLLHDCAKLPDSRLLEIANSHEVEITPFEAETPALLHDRVGAILAKEVYGVDDEAVLHAIASHQLLSADISMLDKVVFLADKIERRRCYDGVDELRLAAERDINEAILLFIERNIAHIVSSGRTLHPAIYAARECIKKQMRETEDRT